MDETTQKALRKALREEIDRADWATPAWCALAAKKSMSVYHSTKRPADPQKLLDAMAEAVHTAFLSYRSMRLRATIGSRLLHDP